MKTEYRQVNLPEGVFQVQVDVFEPADKIILSNIYKNWRALCNELTSINSRCVNLPEGLSEGAFCLNTGAFRITDGIPGANSSFDCYDPRTHDRIQIKACSVLPDLTSFGPRSVWDKLYFLDFYRGGAWDGKFNVFLINNTDIYNHMINSSQTFKDQQAQGRRPRFSIYSEIIVRRGLKPISTYSLI